MMGQAISSLLVAALTWVGLLLLGVPAAGGLGVIAGLLDIIPMVGPIIAGVPAVLLAFTVSGPLQRCGRCCCSSPSSN